MNTIGPIITLVAAAIAIKDIVIPHATLKGGDPSLPSPGFRLGFVGPGNPMGIHGVREPQASMAPRHPWHQAFPAPGVHGHQAHEAITPGSQPTRVHLEQRAHRSHRAAVLDE